MIQIQSLAAEIKQPGNCGRCSEKKYLYECSLCQREYCRDCAKSIQLVGSIYVICAACLMAIANQYGYEVHHKRT
jgi:predicted SprT family Zn-dependent metalloprotease